MPEMLPSGKCKNHPNQCPSCRRLALMALMAKKPQMRLVRLIVFLRLEPQFQSVKIDQGD